jgi:antirestriction protein
MKTMTDTVPRVYVGTYAKYNAGSIAGKWIDLEEFAGDKSGFLDKCKELHADEADPELMFQDFEGFPRAFYGESGLDDGLFEWLELDEDDRELLSVYQSAIGCDGDIDDAREAFQGRFDSEADFCESIAEETGAVAKDFPSWISIDWDATWNCSLKYDYVSERHNGEVWIFRRM